MRAGHGLCVCACVCPYSPLWTVFFFALRTTPPHPPQPRCAALSLRCCHVHILYSDTLCPCLSYLTRQTGSGRLKVARVPSAHTNATARSFSRPLSYSLKEAIKKNKKKKQMRADGDMLTFVVFTVQLVRKRCIITEQDDTHALTFTIPKS